MIIYQRQLKSGFTLIEVLLVFAIVSLLSSVILASTKNSKDRARTAKALEFSQTIFHRLGAEAVGVWGFEEGSGTTVNDASGFNNHGTLTNGAAFNPDTPYDAVGQGDGRFSLSFDGVDDYVDMGDLFYSDIFTVCAWIYADTLNATNVKIIVAKRNIGITGSTNEWSFDISNGYVHLISWATGSVTIFNATGGTALNTNTWYHVCGVQNGNGKKGNVYLNGAQDGSYTQTGTMVDSSSRVQIGVRTNGDNARYWDGLIDDVQIYNTSLTQTQIQKHYAEGLEKHQNLAQK